MIVINFTTEQRGWKYLLPALFDFECFEYNWELCRLNEGLSLADEVLQKDNRKVFTAVQSGHEKHFIKWLKYAGVPSEIVKVFYWSTEESVILGTPSVWLPKLPIEYDRFILNLINKHQYPLIRLLNERAVDVLDRQYLNHILSPQLAKVLALQFNSLSQQVTIHPETINLCENSQGSGSELPDWAKALGSDPNLPIISHIDEFNVITESEAIALLGSARRVRTFSARREEYNERLPFSIKVESSPNGNRYKKEQK